MAEIPRLVLLHGGPGLDDSYFYPFLTPLWSRLELTSYRLAGRSISDLVQQLKQEIGTGDRSAPFFLLGHSFGAAVCLEYLSAGFQPPAGLLLMNWMYDTAWRRDFESNHPGREASAISNAGETFASPDDQMRAEQLTYTDVFFAPTHQREGWEVLNRIRYDASIWNRFQSEYFRDDLDLAPVIARLAIPVLSMAGEYDGLMHARYYDRVLNLRPRLPHKVILDAGHFPFVEKPQSVMDEITTFIQSAGGFSVS